MCSDAAELDDIQFLVLNAICLKKMAGVGNVADACDLPVADVEAALEMLEKRGLVAGAGGNYLPTNDAVPTVQAWANRAHAAIRDDDMEKLHERFEQINRSFLGAMTSWQQVPLGDKKVTNDHTDAEYDARVIKAIEGLVRRLDRILDRLAEHVPRVTLYSRRFAASLEEVHAGNIEFVAKPTIDSIHNVWFEFHEDLLRILGKEREG